MSAQPQPRIFALRNAEGLDILREAFSRISQRELESTLPYTTRDIYYVEQLHAFFRQDPLTYITSRPEEQQSALFTLVLAHARDIEDERRLKPKSNEQR